MTFKNINKGFCFQVYARVGGGRVVVPAPSAAVAKRDCKAYCQANLPEVRSFKLIQVSGKRIKTPGKLVRI